MDSRHTNLTQTLEETPALVTSVHLSCPSVRPSVRPSVMSFRPYVISVCPSVCLVHLSCPSIRLSCLNRMQRVRYFDFYLFGLAKIKLKI